MAPLPRPVAIAVLLCLCGTVTSLPAPMDDFFNLKIRTNADTSSSGHPHGASHDYYPFEVQTARLGGVSGSASTYGGFHTSRPVDLYTSATGHGAYYGEQGARAHGYYQAQEGHQFGEPFLEQLDYSSQDFGSFGTGGINYYKNAAGQHYGGCSLSSSQQLGMQHSHKWQTREDNLYSQDDKSSYVDHSNTWGELGAVFSQSYNQGGDGSSSQDHGQEGYSNSVPPDPAGVAHDVPYVDLGFEWTDAQEQCWKRLSDDQKATIFTVVEHMIGLKKLAIHSKVRSVVNPVVAMQMLSGQEAAIVRALDVIVPNTKRYAQQELSTTTSSAPKEKKRAPWMIDTDEIQRKQIISIVKRAFGYSEKSIQHWELLAKPKVTEDDMLGLNILAMEQRGASDAEIRNYITQVTGVKPRLKKRLNFF
ncbi:hypothetical protein CBS101457_000228 [Exobasidium rhododendri]|nr:hypothetical protein CBS101457_000228 [Exobasidium rhododendri]